MIVFEHGMLVLDNSTTKEDVDAVKEFADNVRKQERERFARIANTMLDKDTAEEIIFLVNDVNVL